MRTVAIIAAALILPLLWSWLVYWGMSRLWPAKWVKPGPRNADDSAPGSYPDYQI